MRAMDRILGRNDNASVAGLVDVGSYSACIVDKENQRIPYGRVKIGREGQVIRQDLSGAPAGLETGTALKAIPFRSLFCRFDMRLVWSGVKPGFSLEFYHNERAVLSLGCRQC